MLLDVLAGVSPRGLDADAVLEAAAALDRVISLAQAAQTPAQLRAAVRRAVARIDPAGAQRREALAWADRRVTLTPAEDGMAELWALLPAAEAAAAYRRVDQLARASGRGDGRSADQRRADCLTDLLLDSDHGRVHVQVGVTVAASTLAGSDDEPGDLAGYGPITAQTARELAGGALGSDSQIEIWRIRAVIQDTDDRAVTIRFSLVADRWL